MEDTAAIDASGEREEAVGFIPFDIGSLRVARWKLGLAWRMVHAEQYLCPKVIYQNWKKGEKDVAHYTEQMAA